MAKRWISEQHLAQLPPEMTARALGGVAYKPKAVPAPKRAPSGSSPAEAGALATKVLEKAATKAMTATQSMQALGRLPVGEMNKTEQAYADHLEQLKRDGEVLFYKFESMNLRLADNTFYKPDFLVMTADRGIEVHEVKGFWTDDARVKIKVAAALYPIFKFIAIRKAKKADGGGWSVEEF